MTSGETAGRIITFYSYKGGTGRTMALANTAWILASRGRRVLVVDWDLEAPGLDRFLHPFLDQQRLHEAPGVVNLLTDYMLAFGQECASGRSPWIDDDADRRARWIAPHARVGRGILNVDWRHFAAGGRLDYLSPGRLNRDYSASFSHVEWSNFFDYCYGGEFLDALRAEMSRDYDYVLIDSRTGLSDVADICTIQLPDTVVDCFTLNDQSINGAFKVAERVGDLYQGKRRIRVLPVPTRVEDAEADRLEAARAKVRHRFRRVLAASGLDPQRYWGAVEMPYKAAYAYEEVLAAFREAPGSPTTLLAACERLTSFITDGDVCELAPMKEELRRTYLDSFIRRRPPGPIDVFLSYVPEDRMWADWIAAVLSDAGFAVRHERFGGGETAGSPLRQETEQHVEAASRTVAVLSANYQNSAEARAVWESVAASDPMGARRSLVPVRVSDVRLRRPFSDLSPVDLSPLEEEGARQTLLRAMDAPHQLQPHPADQQRGGPRYPGAVPPVWSVPLRNSTFTGRAELLDRLRERLEDGTPALLHGMGGVGKTQLALEYAHRFMTDYDVVWWIPAERHNAGRQKFAELAGPLGLQPGDSIGRTVEVVREALRRGEPYGRWLLVFDNPRDPAELAPMLVSGNGGGHVVITARKEGWERVAAPLEVDVFSRAESVQHLARRVPSIGQQAADRVADTIGDLPLAVDQAAAWLNETALDADVYLDLLNRQFDSVRGRVEQGAPGESPLAVAATWQVSIDQLRQKYPVAVRLLEFCSCFGADPVSLDLLYGKEMVDALREDSRELDENLMLARAIQELSRFALVKVDRKGRSLQIHRLVQAVVRSSMSDERQREAVRVVHRVLFGARPSQGDVESPENWATYAAIWPHLVVPWTGRARDNRVRQLMVDRMTYLRSRGELASARELGEDLVAAWTPHTGENDRWTLHMRFQIANVLRAQGWYAEALELNLDVLGRQQETLGEDDLHTLMTASSVTADMRGVGRFTDALELDRTTRDRFVHLFGDDHPRTLMAANNYAVSLRMAGRCEEAREVDRGTLEARHNTLGPDHPLTHFSAVNLGRDLRSCGDYTASAAMLRGIYERACGHPDLGNEYPLAQRAAKALALSLRRTGELEEAERLTREVLDSCRRRLGDRSPETLVVWMGLAGHWSVARRFPEARDLLEKLHADFVAVLDESHPLTLACAANYCVQLLGAGEVERAHAMAERTGAALRDLLGAGHPFTLSCDVDLANAAAARGDLAAAERLYRGSLDGLRGLLGPGHPAVLLCEADLDLLPRRAGTRQQDEAGGRAQHVLAEKLGAEHPLVAQLRDRVPVGLTLDPHPI